MADEAPSELLSRRHQMFPVLTEPRSRACALRHAADATRTARRLFAAGEPGPGMFVVLQAAWSRSASATAWGTWCRSCSRAAATSWPRSGTLSGRPSLVDGIAQDDVEALLVPPGQLRALIIAEADLGERLVRALILRRVALIESGASGPVLIGAAAVARRAAAAELPAPQRPAATTSSMPARTPTPPR